MKQPKFKFGDKLVVGDGYSFELACIFRDANDEFRYMSDCDGYPYKDHEVELYTVPKPKKLYAYRVMGKLPEIKHFMSELRFDDAKSNNYVRDSGYDIEYPVNAPSSCLDQG